MVGGGGGRTCEVGPGPPISAGDARPEVTLAPRQTRLARRRVAVVRVLPVTPANA